MSSERESRDLAALRETIELLADDECRRDLDAAEFAVANGDVVRGVEAVRALLRDRT